MGISLKGVRIEETHGGAPCYQEPRKPCYEYACYRTSSFREAESLSAQEAHQMSLQMKNQTLTMTWLVGQLASR